MIGRLCLPRASPPTAYSVNHMTKFSLVFCLDLKLGKGYDKGKLGLVAVRVRNNVVVIARIG